VQAVGANTIFKQIGRDWYRIQIGRDWGAKVKVCTPVHRLCVSSIAKKKKKVRVLEYTFSLLPLSLVRFGFCTNLVRFRFSSLN